MKRQKISSALSEVFIADLLVSRAILKDHLFDTAHNI